MRVHIFDPQLGAVDGHYWNYDEAIIRSLQHRNILGQVFGSLALKAIGYDAAVIGALQRREVMGEVFGSRTLVQADPPPLPAEPVFSLQIFEEVGRDSETWMVENFMKLNDLILNDLKTLESNRFLSSDIAFFPNILQNQIEGVRRWILSLPSENRPTLAIKPSYLTHLMPYMGGRRNLEVLPQMIRHAIWTLMRDHPRTALLTDSAELAHVLRAITDHPFAVLPLPLSIEEGDMPARNEKGLICAYLGHASPLKGFNLLPDIVEELLETSSLKFVIQSYGEEGFRAPIDQALEARPEDRVRLIKGALGSSAYQGLLKEADIVLMPYARAYYEWASSGVLVEAVSAGSVVVVPEGSWLAGEAARLGAGAVTFRTQTPEAVAAALRTAADNFEALSAAAKAAAPAARAHHSPDKVVDMLLSEAAAAGARRGSERQTAAP